MSYMNGQEKRTPEPAVYLKYFPNYLSKSTPFYNVCQIPLHPASWSQGVMLPYPPHTWVKKSWGPPSGWAGSHGFCWGSARTEKLIKTDYNYEILWPAYEFIANEDVNLELINKFEHLFLPAVDLRKAYNHFEDGIHYYNFLKLIVVGTLHYFSFNDCDLKVANDLSSMA